MSGTEDRALLALRMLGVASSSEVSHRLLSEASKWSPDSEDVVSFPSTPAESSFATLSRLPARWAERAVAALDVSTPVGARCAALAAADRRAGVRRALAAKPGLPLESLELVVDAAVDAGDLQCLELVVRHQDATPALWARWLSGETGDAFALHAGWLVSRLRQIAEDEAALRRFIVDARCSGRVVAAALPTVSGSPHLLDVLPLIEARGADEMELLLRDLSWSPAACDARTIEWLEGLEVGFSLRQGALAALEDPELIRRWWRSSIHGSNLALLDADDIVSPVIAETVSAEVIAEADAQLAAGEDRDAVASSALGWCRAMVASAHRRYVPAHDLSEAADVLVVLDAALSVCERFSPDPNTLVVTHMGTLFRVVHGVVDEAVLAPYLERLAAVAPSGAGRVSLLFSSPPEGVAAAVLADPEGCGVTAPSLAGLSMGASLLHEVHQNATPAGLWSGLPELFEQLVVSLPGLAAQLARENPVPQAVGLDRVAAPVVSFVESKLGVDAAAWDVFLSMAPTFEGSVAELVGVASTFSTGS